MKQIKMGFLASMIMLFTACGGGSSSIDTTVPINPDTPQTIAIDKIMAYADDSTLPAPTIEDYIDAGVTGVTSENIDDVNEVVASLTAENVDTIEKIQKIVDDLGINILPTADAGSDKNAEVNQAITITGSGTDIDGTIVSYEWTKDTAVLATTASFEYIPTAAGTDVLTLTVMDDDGATSSDTMNVTVIAEPAVNTPPVADAGEDQNVIEGDPVTLDGSASNDADQDQLTYSWSFSSVPIGSNVDNTSLSSTNVVNPTFTPDIDGSYILELIVNDGKLDSSVDTVVITSSTGNSAPVANAGVDQNVLIGTLVTLNGSGSSDADQDSLTYGWSVISVPNGSNVTTNSLSDNTVINPTFTPDVDGSYVLKLIVNDGAVDSTADTVTITAVQRFTKDYTNKTVSDHITELMWQDDSIKSGDWISAYTYCEDLTLAGYTDWFLPTREQLSSLLDSRYFPKIDPIFDYIMARGYWTSTTENHEAWNVHFGDGTTYKILKTGSSYYRCVRLGQ